MDYSLPRFDAAGIVIVGDILLDRYWNGVADRISPEAPVSVVKINDSYDRPGGAANVALNATSLGAPVWLLGLTGQDDEAKVLETCLESAGVVSDFIRLENKSTITKLRVISQQQQLIRLDFEKLFDEKDAILVPSRLELLLSKARILVISDYGKGTISDCQALIKMAKNHNIPVLIDPKGSDFSRYKGASVITPNIGEFEAVVGLCANENQLIKKGKALCRKLSLEALLVTQGELGMTLVREHEKPLHFPAQAKEVFDVTGAGDTVIATLAVSLANTQDLEFSAMLANVAASVVVGKLGTGTTSLPELRRELGRINGSGCGVVSIEQLLLALESARESGERIVFTNGCFDIIHAGHVGYLDQARELGDRLIVGVNSDLSVKRLKGDGRPVNVVKRRMDVLAGLKSVDWVVSFEEDTPKRLLHLIKPDILVKGGDYSVDEVIGNEIVLEGGGQVKVLDFHDNCSTTAIMKRIMEQTEGAL